MSMDHLLVEVSARHVHLLPDNVEKLFGKGAELTPRTELTTRGLYAAKERVDVVGPKGTIKGLTILLPLRKNQVEVSMSDARILGLDPPFRESGDHEGTPGCTLVGPAGTLKFEKGVIVSWRHAHVSQEDAAEWGVEDGDIIDVEVNEPCRHIIFGDVIVRTYHGHTSFVHIDTDEGNAGNIRKRAYGKIVGITKKAK